MSRPSLPFIARLSLLLSLSAVLFTFPSCDEKTEETEVELKVNFTPGGNLFDPATVYNINGTAVQFNALRFYLSGLTLEDVAGNTVSTDAYVLAQPNDEAYALGSVPPQAYTAFNFNVGIDAAANAEDANALPSSNPLGPQSPNMYWSWASGYIFVRIDGTYDADGNGTPDAGSGFEVHLGTDNFLSSLSLPGTFTAEEEGILTITLNYDPLALFTGIDFPTVNTTHTMDNMPMAMQVKNNIAAAFTLDN